MTHLLPAPNRSHPPDRGDDQWFDVWSCSGWCWPWWPPAAAAAAVFDDSVSAAVEWIESHRADYLAGEVTLFSINAPTCPGGVQGVVEVPWGPEWNDRGGDVICDSELEELTDDIDAFLNGYTAISELAVAG